jgi:hypothetical protein
MRVLGLSCKSCRFDGDVRIECVASAPFYSDNPPMCWVAYTRLWAVVGRFIYMDSHVQ